MSMGLKLTKMLLGREMQTQRLRSQKAHKTVDLTSDKILIDFKATKCKTIFCKNFTCDN